MGVFGHSYDWQLKILIIIFPYFCGSQKKLEFIYRKYFVHHETQEKNVNLSITVLLVSISNTFTFHLENSVLWTLSQIYVAPKTNETPKDKRENNWYEHVLT